jgi:hypothetical protein
LLKVQDTKRKLDKKLASISNITLEPGAASASAISTEMITTAEPETIKEEIRELALQELEVEEKVQDMQISDAVGKYGMVIGKNQEKREILVDLGEDDGIKKGQLFDVYRNDEKIAILKAIKIFDDFSATKILLDQDFDKVEEFDDIMVSYKADN